MPLAWQARNCFHEGPSRRGAGARRFLALLARNANTVVTQKMILEHVWGPEWVEDAQTLRVHVSHLRKKIGQTPNGLRYVITEPGVGFRFRGPDAESDWPTLFEATFLAPPPPSRHPKSPT
jgi:DNA-binding response OmpR family regulator